MKRRSAERLPWPRVTARRFTHQPMATSEFTGHVTLLCIDTVREPLWVESQGRRLCICDAGYIWLQHFPTGTHYAVTTQFDAAGRVIQWYIDICFQHALDAEGVPWWEDLYLDVLVFPDGEYAIADEDELDEALCQGVIDTRLHALAHEEANRIVAAINAGAFPLFHLCYAHRERLLRTLSVDDRMIG